MLAVFFLLASCREKMPRPEEGKEHNETREKFFELRHRAAPGTNWRIIEHTNAMQALRKRQATISVPTSRGGETENFANGQLTGTWIERGSNNLSGNVRIVSYDADNDKLYSISDGGTLWQTNRTGSEWIVLNQNIRFQPDILTLIKNDAGGLRMLTVINKVVHYSDNAGSVFTATSGISFPVEWGGNRVVSLLQSPTDGSVYCITRPWDDETWSPRYKLYRSTNKGMNFSLIHSFNAGNDGMLSMTIPQNSADIFIFETESTAGKGVLYKINGNTVNTVNAGTITADRTCILRGFLQDSQMIWYVLINNRDVFQSLDNGATWQSRGSLPKSAWDMFEISNTDPSKIFAGEVEAYRSINGGISWTKVNTWFSYYGDVENKLHADIMEIQAFRMKDNTPFLITCTHGGVYISYDDQISNKNISLAGHNIGQFYDVLTDPDNTNFIYGGTQDQGFQRTVTANSSAGVLDFIQVISGDYGYMTFSGSPKHLWIEYPFGDMSYYHNPNGTANSSWVMRGSNLPNYGWMLPVENAYTNANEVYMGGGNITGTQSPGSYLVKLNAAITPPYSISATQFAYNFRDNTNTGSANISAIAVDKNNPDQIYIAAEDGTFFYSRDRGITWNKTTSFTGPGPWWLYGSDILVAQKSENKVWYAGSGYSNDPVYESVNGGQSFTAISNGLPSTLVYELTANADETLLFAATEAGPYVYVIAEKQWYPMLGNYAPVQSYTSVEYIDKDDVVRFATYGRGIWDFKIEAPLPVQFLNFNAVLQNKVAKLQWTTTTVQNNKGFEIERSTDGRVFQLIDFVAASRQPTQTHTYSWSDASIAAGKYYYRIRQLDLDGAFVYSDIKSITNVLDANWLKLYPNPAKDFVIVTIAPELSLANTDLKLWSVDGKLVKQYPANAYQMQIAVHSLAAGTYYLTINNGSIKQTVPFVKK